MDTIELNGIRLENQKIESSEFTTVKALVSWMGALQAQDFNMAKWALGLRMINATDKTILDAYNNGEILRTHLMRPTWHFVAADDIYWLLELTAPQIKRIMKFRDKQLELNEMIYIQSNQLLESQLSNGISLSRVELIRIYEQANIKTDENRFSHLMMRAELDGIICNGPIISNKLTYSLLAERVPVRKTLSRDAALAALAKRYFTSHGPATLGDFVWWSGLSVTDARNALEMVKSGFESETIGSGKYWFKNKTAVRQSEEISIHLLPAYDEYLIGYKDRSASLSEVDNRKAVSNNGIFRPLIVMNGQIVGLWNRKILKDRVIIETNLFQPCDIAIEQKIEQAIAKYKYFLGSETGFKIKR